MQYPAVPSVVSIVHEPEGCVLTFSDGKRGVYPDALLYSILELTEPVDAHDHRLSNTLFEIQKTAPSL